MPVAVPWTLARRMLTRPPRLAPGGAQFWDLSEHDSEPESPSVCVYSCVRGVLSVSRHRSASVFVCMSFLASFFGFRDIAQRVHRQREGPTTPRRVARGYNCSFCSQTKPLSAQASCSTSEQIETRNPTRPRLARSESKPSHHHARRFAPPGRIAAFLSPDHRKGNVQPDR